MQNLLVETHKISIEACLMQVFLYNSYGSCVYSILTLMAYDRFVAICKPLQYHAIMTPQKVKLLMFVAHLIPLSTIAVQVILTSRLTLCTFTVNKLLCDNLAIMNLSCQKSTVANVYGLITMTCLICTPVLLIILSYIRVLIVSLKTSKESQKKALRTCAPHLVTFANFSAASLFCLIYNRLSHKLMCGVQV
ncbi:olfactory receptor 6N1-like [Aplochiton taeniatus]